MAQITKIDPVTFEAQSYSPEDEGLILTTPLNTFLQETSFIELYIYDTNNNLISSNNNFTSYKVAESGNSSSPDDIQSIIISPEEDIAREGFGDGGQYITYYNFLNSEIGSNLNQLFISEISSNRTEIRLESSTLSNIQLVEEVENFIDKRDESEYFLDFYLNFGNNNLIIANNIKLENEETDNPSVLIKLYEPLPNSIPLKSRLYIVTTINEPEAFRVFFPAEPIFKKGYDFLKGPNFAIPVKDQVNNSSQNLSYTDIISSAPTSSQDQIDSLLSQSAINISVNYNNFSDFIHFSSAQTRIENFYYKVGLIETYTSESNALTDVTGSSTSKTIIEKNKSNIIKNFDKFEYFMYYSSGSAISYPKSTSTAPYTLFPTTSSQVLTWLGSVDETNSNFGGQLLSASNYDNGNPDQLKKVIPEYLREDSSNQPYDLFVDMVAQYYDNVWLYTKDITQKYNADNRLDFGVSKDLVSDAIKDFGVKLYQNNFSNKELYTAFLGLTPNGSLFPFPEITGSLPTPTGFEFVDTLISASNDVISMDDTNKSLYKRIYHNIPYLLKSKGTLAGLRALITSYGIPDTILKISEFGGKDKVNANDWDLYFNNFNYAFNTTNNFITSSWEVKNTWGAASNNPSTVQFRFKSEEFPPTNLSQSLWQVKSGTNSAELLLDYSGSGLTSGSWDGSIKDPNYQYANLRFIPDNSFPNVSASISLPFYNGDWWSVMITTNDVNRFNLYAGNKIYNGNDGTSIGYYTSASIGGANNTRWVNGTDSIFASSSINYSQYEDFSGSLQEIRYYKSQISESVFKDFVMNPLSFEGNGVNGAPDQLIFRAALGSELDTNTSSSIHPYVTGSWATTSSFASDSNFYFNGSPQYYKNTEYFFLDQPAVGIKNRTTDKIRSENATIPSGNTLSPIRSLSQYTEASASYTDNINYLEVAFSPQNQINDDIIGQMGHFNIGDYIGDPRQRSSSLQAYPDLENLSEEYFKKYIKQYDLVDFVRLIKFFDNSLFKMIKDFIPARTSLASGLVVKQHLLERNKYPQPQVTQSNAYYTGSIDTAFISGGAAGSFNIYNNSYHLEYFSGSVTSNFIVSGSGTVGTYTGDFSNGDTFISSSLGTFDTNADSISYFGNFINSNKATTPNLWVGLKNGSGVVNNGFSSGSILVQHPVSGSGTFSGVTLGNQLFVSATSSNTANGINFTKFVSQGHIQTSTPIFDNGGSLEDAAGLDSVGTSGPSLFLIPTLATQSILTNVSASGTMVYDLSIVERFNLSTSASNALNGFNFSQFDAGNTFISCSTATNEILPFDDGGETGTGIAPITSVTPSTITVDLSGFSGRKAGSAGITYNFSILSGSSSGPTTFVSESGRNLSGVNFTFHTGSVGGGGGTSFLSSSNDPEPHDKAHISNISGSNILNFSSDYTINTTGATATAFTIFSSSAGGETFASSSTAINFTQSFFYEPFFPNPFFPNVTQSYDETFPSILGPVTTIHRSQDEFYNGELSGSAILVSNGELNEECADFKEVNPFLADYKVRTYFDTTSGVTEGRFLQNDNLPIDGHIQIFYGEEPGSPLAPVVPSR